MEKPDNTLMIKRNHWPVQKIDRERGYMWAHGIKFPVPDNSDTLLVPVMLQFPVNEEV